MLGESRFIEVVNEDFVKKIASCQDGVEQNLKSLEVYENAKNTKFESILAIIDNGNENYLIQEKLKVDCFGEIKDVRELSLIDPLFLREFIDTFSLLSGDVYKISSWGYDKLGNLKIHDYGMDVWAFAYKYN